MVKLILFFSTGILLLLPGILMVLSGKILDKSDYLTAYRWSMLASSSYPRDSV